jgi:type IV secretory pathway VirJ component
MSELERWLRSACWGLAVAGMLWASTARADVPATATGLDLLRKVQMYRPASPTPAGVVFLFSDLAGWTSELDKAAHDLAASDLVVLGIDLPSYLTTLRASTDDCLYLISDVEEMAHRVERELAFARYRVPILAGVGAGATLAYAALAQSPDNTVAGAATLDPVPSIVTGKPLCPGAPSTRIGDGYAYGPLEGLPGWWRMGRRGQEEGAMAWVATVPEAETEVMPKDTDVAHGLVRLIEPALEEQAVDDVGELADLPLIELPAAKQPVALALILSGDGGWRDIDEQLGQQLSAGDVAVVGLDSLRYFWQHRAPEQVAKDIGRILDHYMEAWAVSRVMLIGYSFGADILPAAIDLLPARLQAEVTQISLLGLSANATWTISVTGWLGGAGSGDVPNAPDIAKLDMRRVQCFYGEEEADSFCPSPLFDHAERIRTKGGHHFDGDYARLAALIREGFERRRDLPSGNP